MYKGLPEALILNGAWLYKELMQMLDLSDQLEKYYVQRSLYTLKEGKEIEGIILRKALENKEVYFIYALNYDKNYEAIREFVSNINPYDKKMVLSLNNKELAEKLYYEFDMDYERVNNPEHLKNKEEIKFIERIICNYYLDNFNNLTLSKDCKVLTDEVAKTDEGLSFLAGFLEPSGKYNYCTIKDNKVVLKAHIQPVSFEKAELVAISTLNSSNFRNGYAKACCSYGILDKKDEFKVFTFSTLDYNEINKALAKSLGFKEYLTEYYLVL